MNMFEIKKGVNTIQQIFQRIFSRSQYIDLDNDYCELLKTSTLSNDKYFIPSINKQSYVILKYIGIRETEEGKKLWDIKKDIYITFLHCISNLYNDEFWEKLKPLEIYIIPNFIKKKFGFTSNFTSFRRFIESILMIKFPITQIEFIKQFLSNLVIHRHEKLKEIENILKTGKQLTYSYLYNYGNMIISFFAFSEYVIQFEGILFPGLLRFIAEKIDKVSNVDEFVNELISFEKEVYKILIDNKFEKYSDFFSNILKIYNSSIVKNVLEVQDISIWTYFLYNFYMYYLLS